MKAFALILWAMGVMGCTPSYISQADQDGACYWRVSNGGVGNAAKTISGGVQYCQITTGGDCAIDPDVKVTYDGNQCVVEASANDG